MELVDLMNLTYFAAITILPVTTYYGVKINSKSITYLSVIGSIYVFLVYFLRFGYVIVPATVPIACFATLALARRRSR